MTHLRSADGRTHLVEFRCVSGQLLKRGNKKKNRLVWTSCHIANGPVWLHRNRLHAPLQCRSRGLSSAPLTCSPLFCIHPLESFGHQVFVMWFIGAVQHGLYNKYSANQRRKFWDYTKRGRAWLKSQAWCWIEGLMLNFFTGSPLSIREAGLSSF